MIGSIDNTERTFKLISSKKTIKIDRNEILEKLITHIDMDDREEFKLKFYSTINLIFFKPIKKQLQDILISNTNDYLQFPIPIDELVELRNKITHGEIKDIDLNKLGKVNMLMWRLNGILILNKLGIKDWKLRMDGIV